MCRKIRNYTIYKGCHYSDFFPSVVCLNDENVFERKLVFHQSCAYYIDEPSCVNKLFGFCFGFGVHTDSVRFGWTYNNADQCIHIWSYVYNKGKLSKHALTLLPLENHQQTILMDYRIELKRFPSDDTNYRHKYEWHLVIDGVQRAGGNIYSDKLFVTTLGPYFGGDTRAPHKMIIKELKK